MKAADGTPNRSRQLSVLLGASALLVAALGAHSCSRNHRPDLSQFVSVSTKNDLVTFRSKRHLADYVTTLRAAQRRRDGAMMGASGVEGESSPSSTPDEDSDDAGDSSDGESITNTQEAGVDEGGIVKARGDHLIVLRRGRLFTVKVGDKSLRPISMIDVSPPGSNNGTWYDEMLIHDSTVIVMGYSYSAGGTELGMFNVDSGGELSYRGTYVLRSNDYYSSRNYASRLAGDKLVFYMPYALSGYDSEQLDDSLPGLRKFKDARDDWDTIIDATDIYQPIQKTEDPVLHTVVVCDLSKKNLACKATGVVGPYGRTFYVSQKAVYVWVSGGHTPQLSRAEIADAPSVVYRLPLDGSTPGAMRSWGAPVDQFSFKESSDEFLNVLVRAEGGGDWMWSAEATAGDVAMLRVPVEAFSTRVGTPLATAYHALPRPLKGWAFQNRFVGDHLLYGTGSSWGYAQADRDDRVFIYPFAGGEPKALELPHGVDRIEALGRNAVVVGTDGRDLHFSAIDLSDAPRISDRYTQKQAAQGETRSHGFFFKPSGKRDGVLGLPVRNQGAPGFEQLEHGSAEILYLKVDDLSFGRLGALRASNETPDDRCIVSCVDWYGNARPIFYQGRVFALLGYELVEGRITNGRIDEVGRTNMIATMLPKIAR